MKRLYKAESNTMGYYIVEDWESDLAIIVDWDLSPEEEEQLIEDFENEVLDEKANGGDWTSTDKVYMNLFNKKLLS